MKRPVALCRLGTPVFCPADWVVVSRWLARCVVRGRLVVRYASGVVADVASLATVTPLDLQGALVEVYDPSLTVVFQRIDGDPR